MRKTTLSRSLLLTAALTLGATTMTAQTVSPTPVSSPDELTDGYYVIKATPKDNSFSGLVYFNLNDGASRHFRVDQDKQAYEDGTLETAYIWRLTKSDDGTFSLMGMHDNKFIPADASANQNFRGTETANLQITVGDEVNGGTAGAWYVTMTNYQHSGAATYWYNNKPGGDPNLSWWQNIGNGAMQVEFYAISDLPETVNVTYSAKYTDDGRNIGTASYELFIGDTYPTPEINNTPAYVTVGNAPEGTVSAEQTIDIDCTWDGPFAISESVQNATWYAVGLHTAPYYLHNTDGAESMTLGATEQAIDASGIDALNAQMWCFVGNPFDGFKLYNKAAGEGKILSSGNPAGADGTTFPILVDEASLPEGNNTTWDILPSTNIAGVNGFYIAQHGIDANKMNLRDGKLAYWTSGSDAGSTFRALSIANLYAANLEALTRGYVGTPNADAIDAQKDVIDAITFGTGTPEQYVALSQALDAAIEAGQTVALDASKLYRIQNLARKASTGNTNHVGNGGYLEVTDKAVTEYTVDMAAIDTDPSRATALWQIQPIEGQDGHFRLYNPNAGVYVGSVVEDSYLTTATSVDEAGNISLVSLGQAQFRLRNEQNNGPLHASGPQAYNKAGIQIYGGDANSPSAWYLIPAETIDVTIGEAGYATINLPVAVQLPEGLTAYTAKEETADAVKLTEIEGNVLPAGSPVLLGGEEGTYTLTLLPADQTAALTTGFGGTLMAAAVPDDVNAYILAKKEGDTEAKFYQLAESTPVYAPLYYHLVTRANNAERAGRAIELVAEGSPLIESNSAVVGQLWSAPANESNDYQIWKMEADPNGSGKFAMICKAQPNGSVNPTPTAVGTGGRWTYDNSQKHYGFILNHGGTADGVDYYYITSSDQTTTGWFMNTAGSGQGLSINLYNNINDGSDAGYFSFNVTEYDTDEVTGTDNTPRVIAANKAYYVSTLATGEALSLSFGGPAVGIDQIATPGAEKAQTYYDLQGRRVLYPSNGIFVTEDGQKVFIK